MLTGMGRALTSKPRLSILLGGAAILAGAFVVSAATAATSMRCGSRLIGEGDTRHEVRTVCGTPDDELERTEYRSVRVQVRVPCGEGKRCLRSRVREVEIVIHTVNTVDAVFCNRT